MQRRRPQRGTRRTRRAAIRRPGLRRSRRPRNARSRVDRPVGQGRVARPPVESAAVRQRYPGRHAALQPVAGRQSQRRHPHRRPELDAPQGPEEPWPSASGTIWSWSAMPASAVACGSTSTGGSPATSDWRLGCRLDLDRFRLGAWNRWEGSPGNNFHGELDDVRIYSGMLSDEEAAQLAKGAPAGK